MKGVVRVVLLRREVPLTGDFVTARFFLCHYWPPPNNNYNGIWGLTVVVVAEEGRSSGSSGSSGIRGEGKTHLSSATHHHSVLVVVTPPCHHNQPTSSSIDHLHH